MAPFQPTGDFDFRNARQMQGGAAAAGNSTLAETFAALKKPDWGGMAATNIDAAGYEEIGIRNANTKVRNSLIAQTANVKATELAADARVQAAREQAQGSTFGSIVKAGVSLLGSFALSDERTKNTIEHIDDALSTLRQLKPVSFYYNEEYSSNPERIHNGFIAQDYAKVLPAATYYDDSLDRLCIDTGELIALLVRAVQQLESKVTRMEAKSVLEKV